MSLRLRMIDVVVYASILMFFIWLLFQGYGVAALVVMVILLYLLMNKMGEERRKINSGKYFTTTVRWIDGPLSRESRTALLHLSGVVSVHAHSDGERQTLRIIARSEEMTESLEAVGQFLDDCPTIA